MSVTGFEVQLILGNIWNNSLLQNRTPPIWIKGYVVFSYLSTITTLVSPIFLDLDFGWSSSGWKQFHSECDWLRVRALRKRDFPPHLPRHIPILPNPIPSHPIPHTMQRLMWQSSQTGHRVDSDFFFFIFFKLLLCTRRLTEHFMHTSAAITLHPQKTGQKQIEHKPIPMHFPSKRQPVLEVPETSQESLLLFSS